MFGQHSSESFIGSLGYCMYAIEVRLSFVWAVFVGGLMALRIW
jgi:hypothetical protein